jgi:hypothetical protein
MSLRYCCRWAARVKGTVSYSRRQRSFSD